MWRSLLDRPLTSYYLVLGITVLLLGLGLVMVQSTGSVADLAAGLGAVLGLQEAVAGRRRRPAADVGGGALVPPAVPGPRLPAARDRGGRALPHAHPRRRRLAERRVAVDQPRRAADPAVGDRQARPGDMGRRPAGPQGEARPAGRLAAHPRAAHARRGPALPARDDRRRPRHHVHPAGHLPRPAVGHRHPRADLQRPADPDGPGHGAHDRLGEVPVRAPHRLPQPAGRRHRRELAGHPRASTRCPRAASSASASAPAGRSGATYRNPPATSSSPSSARNSGWSERCA